MTKTIIILAIAAAFVAGTIGTGTIAYAGDDSDDSEDQPLLFSWNPDDTSSDPNNLIIVNGVFARQGLGSSIPQRSGSVLLDHKIMML